MEHEIIFDANLVASAVKLPLPQVKATIELLDEGNTIPFITRFRKDQTKGLNESQIRSIKRETAFQRGLIERKTTVLKSIETQNVADEQLIAGIKNAQTHKRLEDLYLPHRPKRQSLAAAARQQGLEPLARELLESKQNEFDLATRALDFVRVDRGVTSIEQVYEGTGHLIAEHFSEKIEVREKLRDFLWRTGKLASKKTEEAQPAKPEMQNSAKTKVETGKVETPKTETVKTKTPKDGADETSLEESIEDNAKKTDASPEIKEATSETDKPNTQSAPEVDITKTTTLELPAADDNQSDPLHTPLEKASGESSPDDSNHDAESKTEFTANDNLAVEKAASAEAPKPTLETTSAAKATDADASSKPTNSEPTAEAATPNANTNATATSSPAVATKNKRRKKKKKKKKKSSKTEDLFKDFFDFSELLRSVPPHRILALNRGERAKLLRVRVDADHAEMQKLAANSLFKETEQKSDFLARCASDAIARLILPSLEREVRRELTETSEQHALRVFAKNLRNLLLQPPLRNHRVVAIDPAYRSGCRFAVLDEFGKPLETGVLYIIGSDERIEQGKEALVAAIRKHGVTAIAIGNGAACRETEKFVADMISTKLATESIAYAIVNEAGASTYSTSQIGREELPDHEPNDRSAISIGRRLLDPLSELVKISPENLGIGMYQHDVKAKHLHEQLSEVVESCVNFVGVDVNMASPSLLSYVAGLNQLTARRVYEYRLENGPFKNREEFKNIPGFGGVTFTQSAGFLRINDGDNPLDATSIHPESYDVVQKVLEKLDIDLKQIVSASQELSEPVRPLVPVRNNLVSSDPESKSKSESTDSTPATPEPTPKPTQPTPEPVSTPDLASPPESTGTETTSPESSSALNPVTAGTTQVDRERQRETAMVRSEKMNALREKTKQVDIAKLSGELSIGQLLLRDILGTIARPTRDPRDRLPKPVFRREFLKLEDLVQGRLVRGRVVNVVDFGAFVDIGMGESSLVHISQLSSHYVRDPHDVVAIGDLLKLWVTQVDKSRRRITLTAINPSPKSRRKPNTPVRSTNTKPQRRDSKPSGQRQSRKPVNRKPKKPVPVKPITDGMKEGKEALRSFSDLSQFLNLPKDKKNKK